MMRTLLTIFCVICVATVLTEALGLAYLSLNGQLNAETVADIRLVFSGGVRQGPKGDSEEQRQTPPSSDDVMERRVDRVWDLLRRQQELAVIKNTVSSQAAKVTRTRQDFQKKKETFLSELQTIAGELDSSSAEQSRGILIKLPPADAVQNLMALSLDQNVLLLKGMPDQAVATLLEQFRKNNDPKTIERGQKIFEAISMGEPKRKVVKAGAKQLQTPPKLLPKQP
jgi:flagellar motility protein MotE (MotC chaperone)